MQLFFIRSLETIRTKNFNGMWLWMLFFGLIAYCWYSFMIKACHSYVICWNFFIQAFHLTSSIAFFIKIKRTVSTINYSVSKFLLVAPLSYCFCLSSVVSIFWRNMISFCFRFLNRLRKRRNISMLDLIAVVRLHHRNDLLVQHLLEFKKRSK